MKFEPHEYQEFCIDRLTERTEAGWLLDMGLGKTIIALTAIDRLLLIDAKRVLVIAPLHVAAATWPKEAAKFYHLQHLRITPVLGTEQQRIDALARPADIHIINRENVPWLVDYYGKRWPFDTVVVDELSSFKNPGSKRFKALRRVRPLIHRMYGMTGTPRPNGLLDLWAQMYLLDQGERLGKSLTQFRDRYFTPGKRNGNIVYEWKPKPGAEDEIYAKLSDLCVSMKAKDYLVLPERVDIIKTVKLSAAAAEQYAEMEREEILRLAEGVVDAGTAAVVTNKLRQIAGGAVYDADRKAIPLHGAKLDALEEILEAANNQPVLVAYAYQHEADRIAARFPQARRLIGTADIDAWNRGEIPVLLAHPASAGHGLNLQEGGHIAVWFSPTWSLEQDQQFNARLHRQGQREAVTIFYLVAEATIDEDVMAALKRKEQGQSAMLDAVKARLDKYKRAQGRKYF